MSCQTILVYIRIGYRVRLTLFFKFDYVMNEFVFGINNIKEPDSGIKVTNVTFDEIENDELLNHLSVAFAVARKYTF